MSFRLNSRHRPAHLAQTLTAILFIAFFLLAAIAHTLYRTRRRSDSSHAARFTETSSPPLLFATPSSTISSVNRQSLTEAGGAEAAAIHSALVARAAAGDPNVLDQARAASDERLYEEVLRELSAHAAQKSPDKLRALALHIAHGRGLRADVNLVRRFAALWRQSPNQEDAATLLRLAALSNDADAFLSVANEIVNRWQRGQLPQLSAPVLQSLIESDFWLLSSEARRSGGGYLLKRRLLSLRGELAKAGSSASSDNSAVLGD